VRPSRMKLGLCLLVLLSTPFTGLVSRAEASFMLRPTAAAEVIDPSGWLEPLLRLDSSWQGEPVSGPPASSTGEAPLVPAEEEGSRNPQLPRTFTPAYPDLQHGGSMSTDSAPSGFGAGGGLYPLTTSSDNLAGPNASERLFLAEDRQKPPPFSSRLFRPPRFRAC